MQVTLEQMQELEKAAKKAKKAGLTIRFDDEEGCYQVVNRKGEVTFRADRIAGLGPHLGAAPPPVERFDGETTSQEDAPRLNAQMRRVWEALSDGQWYTLGELSEATGDPEASISARIRDLRKPRFGGYTVNSQGAGGTWRYQLVPGVTPTLGR